MSFLKRFLFANFFLIGLCAHAEGREPLTFWVMGDGAGRISEIMAEFERLNPDISVDVEPVPWSGAYVKILTAMMSGTAPDVSQIGSDNSVELMAMNVVENLEPYIAASKTFAKSKFLESTTQQYRFQGTWASVPWFTDTRVVFYRQDILEKLGYSKPPDRWPAFLTMMQKLMDSKKQHADVGFGMPINAKDTQTTRIFYLASGGRLFPDGLSGPMFEPDRLLATLSFMRELFARGITPPNVDGDTELYVTFATGYFPVFISGPWSLTAVAKAAEAMPIRWMTAPMPTDSEHGGFFKGGCDVVMFKSSTHKQAAWRLIEFLSSPDIQLEMYKATTQLPVIREVWNQPLLRESPYLQAFETQLKAPGSSTAESELSITTLAKVYEVVASDFERVLRGKDSPQVGVQKILAETHEVVRQHARSNHSKWRFLLIVFLVGGLSFTFIRRRRDVSTSPQRRLFSAYIFILPCLLFLIVFSFFPIIFSFLGSLTDWDITSVADPLNVSFIGFENYGRLLHDPVFWKAFSNTLLFTLFGVPLNVVLSLALAILIQAQAKNWRAVFRLGFFMPAITTVVAVAVVFRWIYQPDHGLLNSVLAFFGFAPLNWLTSEKLALPSILAMAIWKGFGYNLLVLLAGLQAIPENLYEAISIDGAMGWQKHWYVTVPRLRGMLVFVSTATAIAYIQFFSEPYIMTKGGPLNSTLSVVLYMYDTGFRFYDLGYASSIAYTLCFFIVILTWVQRLMYQRMNSV